MTEHEDDYAAMARDGRLAEAAQAARKLYSQGKPILAKQASDIIRDSSPPTLENFEVIMTLYKDLNAIELAEQVAIRLLAINPTHTSARRTVIESQVKSWNVDNIRLQLEILLKNPALRADDLLFAVWQFLRLPTKPDRDTSRALAHRILALDGLTEQQEFNARQALMKALTLLNQNDEALREAKVALTRAQSLFELATITDVLISLERTDLALDVARKIRYTFSIDSVSVNVLLGRLFAKLGKVVEARDILKLVNHTAITDDWLLGRFHEACYNVELWDEALASAMRLRVSRPDDEFFVLRLAAIKIFGGGTNTPQASTPEQKGFFARLFNRF